MKFNKTAYRKRRNKGLRGQGDKPVHEVERGEGGHMARVAGRLQMVNRKQARQKLRSRYYTPDREILAGFENDDPAKPIKKKIQDKVGKPFTHKGIRHEQGEPKFTGPLYDPSVTNHERVFRQRIKSGRIKVNQVKGESNNGK